jgi:hypothetical protein
MATQMVDVGDRKRLDKFSNAWDHMKTNSQQALKNMSPID